MTLTLCLPILLAHYQLSHRSIHHLSLPHHTTILSTIPSIRTHTHSSSYYLSHYQLSHRSIRHLSLPHHPTHFFSPYSPVLSCFYHVTHHHPPPPTTTTPTTPAPPPSLLLVPQAWNQPPNHRPGPQTPLQGSSTPTCYICTTHTFICLVRPLIIPYLT